MQKELVVNYPQAIIPTKRIERTFTQNLNAVDMHIKQICECLIDLGAEGVSDQINVDGCRFKFNFECTKCD